MTRAARRIAYCTNVHAGADLAATIANLEQHSTRVRDSLGRDRLGIGLWLSAAAVKELPTPDDALRLRDRLDALGLDVVTLNGFPYGDFHVESVKREVYKPDWSQRDRFEYTRRLLEALARLAPEGTKRASISTLPLGWRPAFKQVDAAAMQLNALVDDAQRIEDETGVCVTIDLEPEPGCMLDRSEHVVDLFKRHFSSANARRHLGVCHDICHAAVMFEPQREALARYRGAGIAVNKVQVSNAVECDGSAAAIAALSTFVEQRYLHQTSVRDAKGAVRFFEDLPDALASRAAGTWRTHFHVPIHLEVIGLLDTSQPDILECLSAIGNDDVVLEIETYAWTVLPEALRPKELYQGIADEWRWLEGALHMNATVRAYLELARLSNAPTVVSNSLAGAACAAFALNEPFPALRVGAVAVAAIALYVAGMALNDIADRTIDAKERPHRPIPSGRLSVRGAATFTTCCIVIALALLALVGLPALIAGLVLLALIVAYDLVHALTTWSVILMGACRGLVYVLGALTVSTDIRDASVVGPAFILLAYVAGFSIVARREAEVLNEGSRSDPPRTLLLTITLQFLPFLTLACFVTGPDRAVPSVVRGAIVVLLIAVMAMLFAWLAAATRLIERRPPPIGRAVAMWIAAISLIDALVALRALALGPAIGCIACFIVTRLAQRQIAGT